MTAWRGVDVSCESIRRWVNTFGPIFAKRIKSRSGPPSLRWHLDEIFVKINGKMVYLWRAVDEGTVLDVIVQSRHNTKAALRLLRKLLNNNHVKPERIVTDRLRPYGAALKKLGIKGIQDVGGRKNNRAENSHMPIRRRERKSQRFKSISSSQRHLSSWGQVYNLFNHQRHLISRNKLKIFRNQTQNEWRSVTKAVMA